MIGDVARRLALGDTVGILPGLDELLRYGLLGLFLVLVISASMGGIIQWGPSVRALLAAKDQQIADTSRIRDEAMSGWRVQTDATTRLAAALEERNKVGARGSGRG